MSDLESVFSASEGSNMSSCVSRVVQPQVESCHLIDTHQVTVEGLVEHIVHANYVYRGIVLLATIIRIGVRYTHT